VRFRHLLSSPCDEKADVVKQIFPDNPSTPLHSMLHIASSHLARHTPPTTCTNKPKKGPALIPALIFAPRLCNYTPPFLLVYFLSILVFHLLCHRPSNRIWSMSGPVGDSVLLLVHRIFSRVHTWRRFMDSLHPSCLAEHHRHAKMTCDRANCALDQAPNNDVTFNWCKLPNGRASSPKLLTCMRLVCD